MANTALGNHKTSRVKSSEASRSPRDREVRQAMTSACEAALVGLSVCARTAASPTIAVAVKNAATFLARLRDDLLAGGGAVRPPPRLARLRWEWLASTARVLDGTADHRLLAECARVLENAADLRSDAAVPRHIVERYRLALAEAHSLAAETAPVRLPSPAAI